MDWLGTNNFKKLKSIGNIRLLLASGIFLENLEHRFDLLIVTGEPRHEQIIVTIQAIEAEIGKELSYAVFDTADFLYRANMYDKLIGDILDSEYIKIIDRGILCQLSGRFSESTNQSEDNEDTSSKRTLLALVKTRGNTTEKTIREGGEVLTKQGDGAEKEFINTTGMNSDEAIRVITEKLSEYKILS